MIQLLRLRGRFDIDHGISVCLDRTKPAPFLMNCSTMGLKELLQRTRYRDLQVVPDKQPILMKYIGLMDDLLGVSLKRDRLLQSLLGVYFWMMRPDATLESIGINSIKRSCIFLFCACFPVLIPFTSFTSRLSSGRVAVLVKGASMMVFSSTKNQANLVKR